MPDVAAAFLQPWRDAGDLQASTGQPWRDATGLQSASSAYARPAVGTGSVIVDQGLTAAHVIPEQTTYAVANTLEVVDLRTGQTLPVDSVSMGLSDGSALWTLSASGPRELAWLLMTGDQPATVEVRVNSAPWQFVIEQVQQPGTFGGKAQAGGRSLAATAGAPYWGAQPLLVDAPTTAAQVCVLANLLTGLELDWRVEDWLIDVAEWSALADPLEVIRKMASSIGAVVEAARSGMSVKVSPRYPERPVYWIDRRPEWEIPWAAIESAQTQRLQGPAYDGIVVTGQAKGDVLVARLVGTAGNNQAPMVSDTSLTDEPALRQRAETELAGAGVRALETRVLQIHGGVIERGDLVRCVEPLATWVGLVRSVNVEGRHGWARQTLTIERDAVDFELPGDPYYSDVKFLLLGEGPTDGVQVNPPTGTLTKDEISGNLMSLGNAPFTAGSTVSASVIGQPFGTSWIRFPGDDSSNNFIGVGGVPNWHPAVDVFCFDGWYQVDDLATHALISDDSAFGGGNWNWMLGTGSGKVSFSMKVQPDAAYSIASPDDSVVVGRPFHVEAWGDGTGNVGLIVDGKHVVTGFCPSTIKNPTATSLLIGAQNHWVTFPMFARVLQGYAKCLRFTQRVRHKGKFVPPSTLRQYRPIL